MINAFCYYFGDFGWAHHARGVISALTEHIDIALVSWSSPQPGEQPDDPAARLMLASGRGDLRGNVALGIGPMGAMRTLVGRVKIGFTAWETTRVPRRELEGLAVLDEIWIPSAWGKRILVDNGVDGERIHVVPEGVDPDVFAPEEAARTGARRFRFRFLCVGKWEERKGTADLVRAFCAAFRPDEPVELYLHCWNPARPDVDLAKVVHSIAPAPHPPIRVGPRLAHHQLVALYRSSQAFVLPTRAEGWGLPILEAMASGLPVIVTDYSGHRAYATPELAYLIRVRGMIDVVDPIAFGRGRYGQWAQPDLDHLQHLLRHVYEHREEAAQLGCAARAAVCSRWTWRHAARIAMERLAARGVTSVAQPRQRRGH